jgi:hypothetical protein
MCGCQKNNKVSGMASSSNGTKLAVGGSVGLGSSLAINALVYAFTKKVTDKDKKKWTNVAVSAAKAGLGGYLMLKKKKSVEEVAAGVSMTFTSIVEIAQQLLPDNFRQTLYQEHVSGYMEDDALRIGRPYANDYALTRKTTYGTVFDEIDVDSVTLR